MFIARTGYKTHFRRNHKHYPTTQPERGQYLHLTGRGRGGGTALGAVLQTIDELHTSQPETKQEEDINPQVCHCATYRRGRSSELLFDHAEVDVDADDAKEGLELGVVKHRRRSGGLHRACREPEVGLGPVHHLLVDGMSEEAEEGAHLRERVVPVFDACCRRHMGVGDIETLCHRERKGREACDAQSAREQK
eukprot:1931097-Rhodomonas_salina.2